MARQKPLVCHHLENNSRHALDEHHNCQHREPPPHPRISTCRPGERTDPYRRLPAWHRRGANTLLLPHQVGL